VEAQAIGKPVLCGNVTSLPEVAGGAALEFDPKLPESIVAAIRQIESDAAVRKQLISKGFVNARRFADTDAMANEYLTILEEVARDATPNRRQLRRG
jgi:glycosyltransferase involved in cell wall biosynthesis